MRKHDSKDQFEADFLGEDYDISRFKHDLTSGKLRWLATVLALLNVGLLVFSFYDSSAAPEIHYPVHLKGKYVFVALFITLFIWTFLAFKNWEFHLKNKNSDA